MSGVIAASLAAMVAQPVLPNSVSACYNCSTPEPCASCHQQYVSPQYGTVQETVIVLLSSVIAQLDARAIPDRDGAADGHGRAACRRTDPAVMRDARARRDGVVRPQLLRASRAALLALRLLIPKSREQRGRARLGLRFFHL